MRRLHPLYKGWISFSALIDGYGSITVGNWPTAAGTAADVTINYVITDEERRRKFVCVDPHAIPAVAFIDADMMDSMPPALKAATGVDALTHAIEGYLTKGAWALTDALHLKAIDVISRSLRASVIRVKPRWMRLWRCTIKPAD